MNFPVVKATSYCLVHTPALLTLLGKTQVMEKQKNPDSEYLKKLKESLRTFQDVLSYPPNQVYIGNLIPDDLNNIPRPWYQNGV
jgi:hypothetical protein